MRLKIIVEIEADYNNSESLSLMGDNVKKVLALAQGGVLRQYVDRLIYAGSLPSRSFIPGISLSTHIDLRDEEKKD